MIVCALLMEGGPVGDSVCFTDGRLSVGGSVCFVDGRLSVGGKSYT